MSKLPISKPSARAKVRSLQRERKQLRAERREMIFDMLVAGFRHDEIANHFGVSVKSLRHEIDRALDERRPAAPQRYVNLQLARLDKAMTVVYEAMHDANLEAVPLLFKVQAQYDRYQGFSAWLAAGEKNLRSGQISAPRALESLPGEHAIGALPDAP
jgi:hypothetical protein